MKYIILSFVFTFTLFASHSLEKVSLQLMWLDQFQFAGYYMAKEKGFYEEAGLDVDIKKFKYSLDVLDEVLSSRATYGVGRSSLIKFYADGKDIALLSAIFQSSPSILLSLERPDLQKVEDFFGKKFMSTTDAVEMASIYAMIYSHKLNKNEIITKEHTFDLEELIDGRVDLYAAYISNEPYHLKQRDIAYKIFAPKDHGFDFYNDILFSSQLEVDNNPQRTAKFIEASIKGWEYAFSNIDESIDVILKHYNIQNKSKEALLFEAKELKKLAYANNTQLGNINKEKIQRIFDVYKLMGITDNSLDIDRLVFNPKKNIFTTKELEYLSNKKEINICVAPSSLPYSAIEYGEFVGVGAELLEKVENIIHTPFNLVKTQTWVESISKATNRECDILPIAVKTPSREKYFKFTTPYYNEPLVIVTDKSSNYILDYHSVLDKKFVAVKGQSFIELLRKKYPQISIYEAESSYEALKMVDNGSYFGYLDVFMRSAYLLQKVSNNLKISGQFGEALDVGFAVRDDDKVLFGIFEKIANNIKSSEIQKILNKWVSINYTQKVEYKYLTELLMVLFFILVGFVYRQHSLKTKNTELEKLQNELVKLNQDLESKVNSAVKEIKEKDTYLLHQSRLAQMGEMLSMIAHQWKQPLNSISTIQIAMKAAVELEKYDLEDETQRKEFLKFLDEKFDKLGRYVQNLSSVIADFSDFYRPNKESKITSIDDVVTKAISLVEDSIIASGVRIDLNLNSQTKTKVHENEFIQVVLNIVNNAKEQLLQKEIDNPYIHIKSYENEGKIYLEICDNAKGIDEDIMDKIFDPYFSTKLDKNGTGLGLYMSRVIIRDYHNGDISVKNSLDGAVFTIGIKYNN